MNTNNQGREASLSSLLDKLSDLGLMYEEKSVQRYFDNVLKLLGLDKQEFKNEKGRIGFSYDIEDFLVWLYPLTEKEYLKNLRLEKEITLDNAIEFQDLLIQYISELDDENPHKSRLMEYADDLTLKNSNDLFKNTMKKVNTLSNLFERLPPKERIKILENLNTSMDTWIDKLKKLTSNS